MKERRIDPLVNSVPDELFVNREDELALFTNWANSIPRLPLNSFALVGRRRTGKTAILKKVYNWLFHEQERILPVYISFDGYLSRQEPISSYQFAEEYFSGYIRSYLAFTYRKPLLMRPQFNLPDLQAFAHSVQDEYVLRLFSQYEILLPRHIPHSLVKWVINFPWGVADIRDTPTAILVDEFQVLTKVYDPQQKIHQDYTDNFQQAAEARWAPLLVSGSAVSLLTDHALGGMLNGRFKYKYIQPLSRSYSHDLVFRLGSVSGINVNEELAEAIWQLTAGFPYPIHCLMTSTCQSRVNFPDLSALEEVYIFELTNEQGKLWQHYREEFEKYSHQLNDGLVTRRVMLWATKYPDQRIDAEQVAEEIGVELKEVRASLEKLRWVDVVSKIGLISYKGPTDTMMRHFIEYQHYTEIEKLAPSEVLKDWKKEYLRLRGQTNNEKGQLAEVHVGSIMRGFDGREVDGTLYFNQAGMMQLPDFKKIERRTGLVVDGIPIEIDLIGEWEETSSEDEDEQTEAKQGAWLVQVKYSKKRIREKTVRLFLTQVEAMKKAGYDTTTCWYIAKGGFVKKAAQLLDESGILFSDRAEFNKLANLFGFFGLPE